MQLPENSGILIQARTGSTRLPGKMKSVFYNDLTLAQLIFKKLSSLNTHLPVVLATSTNSNDDCLEEWAKSYGLKVFRGDEEDVMNRFIEAAELYNIKTIMRVCADNPFLSVAHITELLQRQTENNSDYLSYQMKDGTPVIKSHLGLFTEVVKLSALKKAKELTSEKLYREHVTNFIYGNPEKFDVKFIDLAPELSERKDIRLTIDTQEDFETSAMLFSGLCKNNNPEVPISEIISYLRENPTVLAKMQKEIEKNAK